MERNSFSLCNKIAGFFSILALAGCLSPDQQKKFDAVIAVFKGAPTQPSPQPSLPAPESSPSGDFGSDRAKQAKANAELLQEVFRVVYMKEPQNRAEFGNWVDTLNQGASFEGVYNAFTHSSNYRQHETEKKDAAPAAIKAFGEELARLELELFPEMTVFNENSARPLAILGQVSADPDTGVDVVEYGKSKDASRGIVPFPGPSASAAGAPKPDPKVLAEKYSSLFLSSSIFTLKRILGDEALKVIGIKRSVSNENLASWYSQWVVALAARKVDFGLEARNRSDQKFHYDWAMSATQDRLTWEVLNRLHRVLNDADRLK